MKEQGHFTAEVRLVGIYAIAMAIGACCALAALVLLRLIDLFTNLVAVHRCSSSCFAEVVAREHGHHWTTIGVSGYGPWLISTSRSLIRCSRRGCRRHQRTYFRTSRS